MKGLETKHIFKRAMRDLVPAEILDRPKQGFGIPIDERTDAHGVGRA